MNQRKVVFAVRGACFSILVRPFGLLLPTGFGVSSDIGLLRVIDYTVFFVDAHAAHTTDRVRKPPAAINGGGIRPAAVCFASSILANLS